jgi:hypothetical protein
MAGRQVGWLAGWLLAGCWLLGEAKRSGASAGGEPPARNRPVVAQMGRLGPDRKVSN